MKNDPIAPPRVVIVGGGFGGIAAAKALKHLAVRVTLLDRQNHHLFQPLLYQVATAALSPADIAAPLRGILRHQPNAEVIMTCVESIDPAAKTVATSDGPVPYDFLILAAGARHSYYGHDEWEKFAPGLKSLDDALEIRRRTLLAFEIAEKTTDAAERQAALTFVVVGAGPTGVEMAGAISEIARSMLRKDFRHIDGTSARVILLDGSPRVLSGFVPALSESAKRQLENIGVEVRLDTLVAAVEADGVTPKGGGKIFARTIVWAAGNAASPLSTSLGVPLDHQRRVIVKEDLTVPGHPEIFVIGDQANFASDGGQPLPALSPVAMQQGRHAAKNIAIQLVGGWTERFTYLDKGTMATIGTHAAVADVGFMRFSGLLAWLAWLFVHVLFLVSFRNKLSVLLNWAFLYFTFKRGARLITGVKRAPRNPGASGSEEKSAPGSS